MLAQHIITRPVFQPSSKDTSSSTRTPSPAPCNSLDVLDENRLDKGSRTF